MKLSLLTTQAHSPEDNPWQDIPFAPDAGEENHVVNLYPEMTFETVEGFGGAITDSAAYVYSLMDQRQKKELMDAYFSPERMGYRLARIHMDSCDFSLEMYEADSHPEDRALERFSFARTEKYILPMLADAQAAAGRPLELMLSPWSPPAFMKTNGQRTGGGELKPEYREAWADYMCRYILEFQKRGYLVRRISLQNEPKAVQTWDSCIFTPAGQKEFLRDFMAPAMKRHGLEGVEIFLWDHNKERVYEWMRDVIGPETDALVAGAAFHWYSGDHFEALDLARRRFPDKKLIISESCIEFSKFGGEDALQSALRLSHEIIGDLNHGMTAFYDWNLLLDERGGPNHAGNFCLAPFLYDTKSHTLMPQLIRRHFEHFSAYLLPGSMRVGYSKYTDGLDVTAWKRPDGVLAAVLLNRSGKTLPVCLRLADEAARFQLPAGAIATGLIREETV